MRIYLKFLLGYDFLQPNKFPKATSLVAQNYRQNYIFSHNYVDKSIHISYQNIAYLLPNCQNTIDIYSALRYNKFRHNIELFEIY